MGWMTAPHPSGCAGMMGWDTLLLIFSLRRHRLGMGATSPVLGACIFGHGCILQFRHPAVPGHHYLSSGGSRGIVRESTTAIMIYLAHHRYDVFLFEVLPCVAVAPSRAKQTHGRPGNRAQSFGTLEDTPDANTLDVFVSSSPGLGLRRRRRNETRRLRRSTNSPIRRTLWRTSSTS